MLPFRLEKNRSTLLFTTAVLALYKVILDTGFQNMSK